MKQLLNMVVAASVVGLSWVQTFAASCAPMGGTGDCCCTAPAPEEEMHSCCEPEAGLASLPEDDSSGCTCSISHVDGTIPKAFCLVDGSRVHDLDEYPVTAILCVLSVDGPSRSFHTMHSAAGPPGRRVSIARLHSSFQL